MVNSSLPLSLLDGFLSKLLQVLFYLVEVFRLIILRLELKKRLKIRCVLREYAVSYAAYCPNNTSV